MSRIKVGDVLSTNKGWSGTVVFVHKNEGVIISNPCEMLFVFNVNDGLVENTEICVILPPAPPEFDWSTVPEFMQVNFLASGASGWFGYQNRPVFVKPYWILQEGSLIYLDQSKLPASLRDWRGDWKDSLIVRPGKGEG